ncbi:cohesin subunit SMC1 [Ascoidea rubescens DSM 1968]|uniref:Structural maintenance of chromosomes protein n=1 Tax=Ascoidea rubescens DSM 1968 TaxID=1344418 RepID=A0A1D2VCV9_9ASCO|nr:putative chromosomal ATPase [Ascoidea rubescens DSM 1968]ODV59449.1 putative chromosomal ATPase [Ascoidea rubescens DSM 1968]
MGRLVGLELHNFKSYRGTSSIGFGTADFISIIGPNGSGKSNMMDAISFVLGVRSSHLRSAHLKDLIYRGRIMSQKKSKNKDNFQIDSESDIESDIDSISNSNYDYSPNSAYVMAIYEKNDGTLINLKRTIISNGSSEYKINDKVVTANDYTNLLKSENILIKARNFLVFQGDVEAIASQSSQDLTKLIETISGSFDLKKQYESFKDQQEKAHDDTHSFFERKRILNRELKQYKEQKEEALNFQAKLNEKKNLIKLFNLWKLFNNQQKKSLLSQNFKEKKKSLRISKDTLLKEESLLKSLSSEYSKDSLNLEKFKREISKRNFDLNNKNKELLPTSAQKDLIQQKLHQYNRKIKELNNDIKIQNNNVKTIKNQLNIVQSALADLEKDSSNTSFSLSAKGQKEYESLRPSYLSNGGADLEQILSQFNQEKLVLQNQLENLLKQKEIVENRINSLKINSQNLKSTLSDNESKITETNKSLNTKKDQLNTFRIEKEKYLAKEYEINSKLKQVLTKLDELNATQRESNRERKLRENVSNLKRLFPGVKGLISDLCRPKQRKYATAVSTALGKNFDSIVVDNLSIASKCITYLKEQRSGVASFIPLDFVDSKPPNPNFRHAHPNARLILDVIEYDPVLERAIQYVCGDSIVCDNMKIAKFVRWERRIAVKVVTLDGSLIHKSGLMTGGVSINDQKKKRWDKQVYNQLEYRRDELLNELNVLSSRKPNEMTEKRIMDEIVKLENTLPLLSTSKNEIKRNIQDCEMELNYQSNDILKFKINEEIKKIKDTKILEIDQNMIDYNNQIKTLQDRIYSEFCKKYNFDSIEEYEKTHGSIIRAHAKERAKITKNISILESKLKFENERLEETTNRQSKIIRERGQYEYSLEQLNKDKEVIEEQIKSLKRDVETLTEKLENLEKDLKQKMLFAKSTEDNVAEARLKYEVLKKKCYNIEEDIEKEIMNRINILRSCKIENIEVPLKRGSLDLLPIGGGDEEGSEEASNVIQISDSIEIDFSELSDELKENLDEDFESSFNEQIAEITSALENLSPNTKALQRLTEVEERLKDVDKEHLKTRKTESRIANQFNEIKEKRYELFMKAFNHIASKIDEIYKDLTKSKASPSGGSAYLTLEDEDEPYNYGIKYHAMPPMKRFRDMEFLSGGEKTIAALALLFAIHSYQPSPFFVLDEVDAALDNANVIKIANYINKNAGPNFQFIVISLKNGLFERSDALVGIYREQGENSSKTLTLDLRNYPNHEVTASG